MGSREGEKGGNRGVRTGVAGLEGTRGEIRVFARPERVGSGGQWKGGRRYGHRCRLVRKCGGNLRSI